MVSAGPANHERKVFEGGSRIFTEGDLGKTAYLIESGLVQFTVKDGSGRDLVLNTAGRGEIFGEMALIDNSPRSATATALQNTVLIVISKRVFEQKLRDADPFIRALLQIFVRTIRYRTELLANR